MAEEMTLSEGLRFERRMFHALFATKDQKEVMCCHLLLFLLMANLLYFTLTPVFLHAGHGSVLGKAQTKLYK